MVKEDSKGASKNSLNFILWIENYELWTMNYELWTMNDSAARREKIGRGNPPKILSLDNITMKNLCLRRFLHKETQMYCAHLLNKIFTFGKENKLSLHSLTQIFCIFAKRFTTALAWKRRWRGSEGQSARWCARHVSWESSSFSS